MYRYHKESDLTIDQIEGGIIRGVLEPWNVDASGEQWYRSLMPIMGVPADAPMHAEDEDADDV